MLYAPAPGNPSRHREWWGTVIISGSGSNPVAVDNGGNGGREMGMGAVVTAGWKGWLRVEREEIGGFVGGSGSESGIGGCVSVEEALAQRERRREVVGRARWVAVGAGGRWGGYAWRE